MNKQILLLLTSNVVVGLVCHGLGNKPVVGPPALTEQQQASTSSLLTPPNARTNSPTPTPNGSPSSDAPSTMAGKGGVRQRLGALMNRLDDLDASDALASLKELRHLPGNPDTLVAQQLLLARYAELDPETALSYVDSLGGFNHEMSRLTVMSAWTAADAEAAAVHYESKLNDFGLFDEDQRITAGTLAAEWSRSDPIAAMEWANQLPEEVRGEAFGRVVAQLTTEDPSQAAELLEAMEPGHERTAMLEAMVSQWAHQDPQSAAEWVLDSTDGEEQLAAVTNLMSSWMTKNPMEASVWLSDMPNGASRDQAILAMTSSRTLIRDPEASVAWSSTIQNPSLRNDAVEKVLSDWLGSDPASASAWLQTQISE